MRKNQRQVSRQSSVDSYTCEQNRDSRTVPEETKPTSDISKLRVEKITLRHP